MLLSTNAVDQIGSGPHPNNCVVVLVEVEDEIMANEVVGGMGDDLTNVDSWRVTVDDDVVVARWEGATKPRASRAEIRPTTREEYGMNLMVSKVQWHYETNEGADMQDEIGWSMLKLLCDVTKISLYLSRSSARGRENKIWRESTHNYWREQEIFCVTDLYVAVAQAKNHHDHGLRLRRRRRHCRRLVRQESKRHVTERIETGHL